MIFRFALSLITAALLGGCLGVPTTDDPSLLRNPTIPLSVISRGSAEAMEGMWFVRRASPNYAENGLVEFDTLETGKPRIVLKSMSCRTPGKCTGFDMEWSAAPIAQNRWQLEAEGSDEALELWVIWIDDGYRTAAIGSPDSDMAFILDRKPKGGADRMTAAREVLAFNGYNMDAFITR